MMRGKEIRLERIMDRNTGKTIIVPMDHGVSNGPIAGLIDLDRAVNLMAEGGANAVLGHVGLALHGHRVADGMLVLSSISRRARRLDLTRMIRSWLIR